MSCSSHECLPTSRLFAMKYLFEAHNFITSLNGEGSNEANKKIFGFPLPPPPQWSRQLQAVKCDLVLSFSTNRRKLGSEHLISPCFLFGLKMHPLLLWFLLATTTFYSCAAAVPKCRWLGIHCFEDISFNLAWTISPDFILIGYDRHC